MPDPRERGNRIDHTREATEQRQERRRQRRPFGCVAYRSGQPDRSSRGACEAPLETVCPARPVREIGMARPESARDRDAHAFSGERGDDSGLIAEPEETLCPPA